MNRNLARLKIISAGLSPEQISELLGLPYDKMWRIGDTRAHTSIVEKDNGWILQSGRSESEALEAHIQELLARLDQFTERIRQVAQNNTVEFSCVIYSDHIPTLNFEPGTLQKICNLGASLDIDLYLI